MKLVFKSPRQAGMEFYGLCDDRNLKVNRINYGDSPKHSDWTFRVGYFGSDKIVVAVATARGFRLAGGPNILDSEEFFRVLQERLDSQE